MITMKNKYLTPELLRDELYAKDVMAASGEIESTPVSSATSSTSSSEVDNAIRAFSALRGN